MSDDKSAESAESRQPSLSRRAALQVGVGLTVAACGGASSSSGPGAGAGVVPTTDEGPALEPLPSDTTAPATKPPPAPSLTPADLLAGIDHIVVLMMENRSFDHFLGALALDPAYAARGKVRGLTGDESNPALDGSPVQSYKLFNFTPADPPHDWDSARVQLDNGTNDGFVRAHAGPSEREVMGYHDRSQIPLYYWFADNFTLCDSWFSSVLGPTWPNRYFLHAASSNGKKDNTPFFSGGPTTVWERLRDKGLSFKNYAAGATTWFTGGFVGKLFSINPSAPLRDFFDDARNGTLPAFSIVDPDFMASDDHPNHNILRGQAFVGSIYRALAESPLWERCLLVVTYDEHGGFFDHVPPPTTNDPNPEFQQLGFRVPAFVIGPTVKKGYVCQEQFDHVSVAATLRTRFGIESLNARMETTNDLHDCIDPARVNAPAKPPSGMPQVAMTATAALTDGVGPSSQPRLEAMMREGISPAVDARPDEERIREWLDHAVRLGAVRVIGR